MSTASAPAKKSGFGVFKAALGGFAGLATGVIGVYATAIVDKVAKPGKPIADFSVKADGKSVSVQNRATGQSGWWDFGDGSSLEPFEPEKDVVHTFAKPGHYAVKLTVRNFLMEENDRSVPVDLTESTAQVGPTITDFTLESIGGAATAPAMFRMRGEVKNADSVIWDLGGEKIEVTDSPTGRFEKLFVIEKSGPVQIQMIGLAGKVPVNKVSMVNVLAPANGAFSVSLKVIDTGTQVERKEFPETVSLPIPAKDAKPVERILKAQPGYTIAEAKLGAVKSTAMKNLKVEIAADKQSAKLTGDWASTGDAAQKASGGAEVMVPVILVQEKAKTTTRPMDLSATFSAEGGFVMQNTANPVRSAIVQLPSVPTGMTNSTRKLQFEINEMSGGKKTVIGAVVDPKLPLKASITSVTTRQGYTIEVMQQANGSLRIVLTPQLNKL